MLNIAYNALSGGTCRHRTAAQRRIWMRWERNGFRIRRRRETAGDSRPTTWSADGATNLRLGVSTATGGVFRRSGVGRGRDTGRNHGGMQARDGRGLRRDVGISPHLAGNTAEPLYLVNSGTALPSHPKEPRNVTASPGSTKPIPLCRQITVAYRRSPATVRQFQISCCAPTRSSSARPSGPFTLLLLTVAIFSPQTPDSVITLCRVDS